MIIAHQANQVEEESSPSPPPAPAPRHQRSTRANTVRGIGEVVDGIRGRGRGRQA